MTGSTLERRFAARMGALLGPDFPSDIALAVSGGGDSMAMLALAHGWARVMGVRLWVVTIDHGLREESGAEAAMVAQECATLGHPHATLRWHWDGQGNLQDAARHARLRLIDQWRGGIAHVLMAHTRDDVAETFLMRLARGSGVEGLAAMADTRSIAAHVADPALAPADIITTGPRPSRRSQECRSGFTVLRPLLQEPRAELRHYLTTLKLPYADDPSNDDPTYDRVKARRLIDALTPLGLGPDALADTAHRLRRARPALAARAAQVARDVIVEATAQGVPTGDLLIDRDAFQPVERDTQLRLLSAALQWIASAPYRPRVAALDALLDRALAGGGGTLHGCEVRAEKTHIRLHREYAALAARRVPVTPQARFDHRWRVTRAPWTGTALRALGPDGWKQIPEKPRDALPFHVARSLPAIFAGDRLLACPALGFGAADPLVFDPLAGSFAAFLVSD